MKITIFFLFVLITMALNCCVFNPYLTNIKGNYEIIYSNNDNNIEKGNGILTGKITDIYSGKPLPFANIVIEDTRIGTKADSLGSYLLTVPEGNYKIIVNCVGNIDIKTKILSVENQNKIIINFYLGTTIVYEH